VDNFSEISDGKESSLGFQVEFVEIKPTGNQSGLQNKAIQAPPPGPGVGTVPFHFSKRTLGLDRAVHAQQGSVGAVEIVENFLMETGQLLVQTNGAVPLCLGALLLERTAGAVLALVDLLGSAVTVPLHWDGAQEAEFLLVWTDQIAVLIYLEIYRPEGILPVLFVGGFLLVHGKLHIFIHSMLFTKEVIVVAAIPGVAHGVIRIAAVMGMKPLHKRLKTVHI